MNYSARKSLGQHFLTDETTLLKIVHALTPRPGLTYVEIGPGLGALTRLVLPLVPQLTAIEFDNHIIPHLEANCAGLGKLIIHQTDVLTVDFSQLAPGKRLLVFGNLPYNISTPILFHLLNYLDMIDEVCFMLQEEVVDRMVANPHTKAYGRLSVMIQYYFEVEKLFSVPPEAFQPPPKVNSAIVRLLPKAKILQQNIDRDKFAKLVNIAFQQRRKTIRNSLHSLLTAEQLHSVGIDPQLRAENLSVDDFVRLTKLL